MYIKFLKRRNLDPGAGEGGEGGGQAQTIDFAANEAAAIQYLKDKGFEVETKENIQKIYVAPAVEKTHSDWESGVAEVIGDKKPEGVKGLNWVKSTLPEKLKAKEKEVDKPAGEENPKGSVADDVTKAEVKSLREKLEALEQSKVNEAKTIAERTVNLTIRSGLKAVKFNGVDEADEQSRRDSVETLIKGRYVVKLDDNNDPVFYKGEEPVIDTQTQKPITFEGLVKRDFAFAIGPDKTVVVGGTGSNKDQEVLKLVDGVQVFIGKNMTEIRNHAVKLGMAVGDAKRTEFIKASAKASNLDPNGI